MKLNFLYFLFLNFSDWAGPPVVAEKELIASWDDDFNYK